MNLLVGQRIMQLRMRRLAPWDLDCLVVTSQGVKRCGGVCFIYLFIYFNFNFIPIKIDIPNKCNNLNSAGKNIFLGKIPQ